MSGHGNAPRYLVLDDSDSTLHWSDGWSAISSNTTLDSLGFAGPTYNNTLHQANSNGASLTFSFEGTEVEIWGTVISTDSSFPKISCTVDKQNASSGDSDPLKNVQSNNVELCSNENMQDGRHDVVLTIDSISAGSFVMVDQIIGLPSSDVSANNAVLMTNPQRDPNESDKFKFPGSQWVSFFDDNDDVLWAYYPDTSFTFPFTGVSVTMFGASLNGSWEDALCSYTLDDDDSKTFTQPGSKDLSNVVGNLPILTLANLSLGSHTLTVINNRSDDKFSPLTFSYFFVGNGSLPVSLGSEGGGNSSAVTHTDSSSSSRGAIAGIVIGSITLLGIMAYVGFFLCQRNRRPKATVDLSGGIEFSPEAAVNEPFLAQPSTAGSRPSSPEMTTARDAADSEPLLGRTAYGQSRRMTDSSEAASSSGASSVTGITSRTSKTSKMYVAGPTAERYVDSEDSGLRIANPMEATIDVPPSYSAN